MPFQTQDLEEGKPSGGTFSFSWGCCLEIFGVVKATPAHLLLTVLLHGLLEVVLPFSFGSSKGE